MKKIFCSLLLICILLVFTACKDTSQNEKIDEPTTEETKTLASVEASTTEESESSEQEIDTPETSSTSLVVYFSVTGNTKAVAEKLASVTNSDLYEIEAAQEYTDEDIDYNDSDSRTSKEQDDPSVRPEIQSPEISMESYDTIYIGYPIWWGEEPRIMDTFVESYDFGDITLIPFCTSGSSSIGNSGNNLAENAGSGNWLAGKRFDSDVSESDLKDWISELQ